MAWPTSLLTSYLAGSTPPIKAADLNAMQSAIIAAFLGTYSHVGLVIDGAGGNVVVPDPGSIRASGIVTVGASAARATAPTPPIVKGAVYQESCLVAFALIDPAAPGNVRYGFNVQSVGYANPGSAIESWIVQLSTPLASPQAALPCAFSIGPQPTIASAAVQSPSGVIQIQTFLNGQATPSQHPCGLLVFGS